MEKYKDDHEGKNSENFPPTDTVLEEDALQRHVSSRFNQAALFKERSHA